MSMNAFHARSRRPHPKPGQARKAVERPQGRQRADALLVARALAPSRSRARQLIEAGSVHADGMLVTRPGQLLPEDVALTVVVE
ncbi:MAG TPA: S4 domain-containing protein [Nitrosomonas halophila]|nr:S4 domain-containing protein [Nitrosomonas halophila]